jgi:hypothetical protein
MHFFKPRLKAIQPVDAGKWRHISPFSLFPARTAIPVPTAEQGKASKGRRTDSKNMAVRAPDPAHFLGGESRAGE